MSSSTKPSHQEHGRDKRYFPRVKYRAYAQILTTSHRYPAHVLDLSFNGALIALLDSHNFSPAEEVVLTIQISETEKIKMQGHISHTKDHLLGIECRATSIDHQARLRVLLDEHKLTPHKQSRETQQMLDDHKGPSLH